ncbi:MAG: hypothetical protein JWM24_631 [Solirubrobacterales bacterium]|nr:hypothetical protein [Solirubrobacterales bacterium]
MVVAEPLRRLQLAQGKIDLQDELETIDSVVDITELENEFIEVAAGYGDRKGISYAAWREVGIAGSTLPGRRDRPEQLEGGAFGNTSTLRVSSE